MITVLYVDDEPELLEIGKIFLEGTGDFSVTTVDSVSAAFDVLKTNHFDAIISDYQMPDIDGLEFLKQVRLLYREIPFILFTGRGREDIVILALNLGADFYLQKGGEPKSQYAELAHKVRQAAGKKLAEQALIQSQAYLNQIFSSVKAGIMIVDYVTHEIVDINPAAMDLIGLPREQIIGNRCHRFICPAEEGQCPISDLHKTIDNTERVLITGQGMKIPIIKYVTRVTLETRECLLETFIDNRERKQAEDNLLQKTEDLHAAYEELTATEEELRFQFDKLVISEQNLRESEDKFRALVEQSLDGTIITDFSGTLLFANPRIGEIIGHKQVLDLVGKSNIIEFVTPEFRGRAISDFSKVAAGTDSFPVEYKILTLDKKEIWIECIGKKISFGGLPSMILCIHDISERKRAEAEIKEAKERFELFFNTTPNAALITRLTDGIITEVNEAFVDLTGFLRKEIVGKTSAEFNIWVHPEECQMFVSEVRKNGFCKNFEAQFWQKNGTRIIGNISGKIIRLQEIPHIVSITFDITDSKRTKEALHMANSKLQLLSGITRHDILNQILVVNAYCIQSERILQDNQKALDFLMKIKKATKKIQQTISFTKDYQELGMNDPVWQNIGKIAQMAAIDLLPEHIVLNVNTENCEIFADPMLMLVFYNLFENVNRHGEKATEIVIGFMENENTGTLIIQDNGVGIPDNLKEQVFERGFGINTGFGLFLIREILAITGLSITETGTAGQGARFEIPLPPGTWRRGPG